MATIRHSLWNNLLPDSSGSVYPHPLSTVGTNDFFAHQVFSFATGTSSVTLHGAGFVPSNYSMSDATVSVAWSAETTLGTVDWYFAYRAIGGSDAESLDQATAQETVNSAVSLPSAIHERMITSIAITHSNLTTNDTLQWRLGRRNESANTALLPCYVTNVYLDYEDD